MPISADSIRKIQLDDLAEKVGGRSRLTYLVSQRLREIKDGAPFLVEPIEGEAQLATVCREISSDKVWLEVAEEVVVEIESTEQDILGDFDDDL